MARFSRISRCQFDVSNRHQIRKKRRLTYETLQTFAAGSTDIELDVTAESLDSNLPV